jgi:hypothetical protein
MSIFDSLFGSNVPKIDYSQNQAQQSQAQAAQQNQLYNQYNMNLGQGNGGVSWSGSGANRTMNVDYSDADKQRQSMIQSMLGGVSTDPTQATQKYYNNALAMLQPEMDKQYNSTVNRAVNMGYNPGSTGFSSAMSDANKGRQLALNDLATNAMGQGQQYVAGQLGNIGSLQGQITNPLQGYVMQNNPYFSSTYDNAAQAQYQNATNQANANNATMGVFGTLGGALLGNSGLFK